MSKTVMLVLADSIFNVQFMIRNLDEMRYFDTRNMTKMV